MLTTKVILPHQVYQLSKVSTTHQSTVFSPQGYPVQPAHDSSNIQGGVQPGQIITLPNGQQVVCVATVPKQQGGISNQAAKL